jgi:hypothetical protein
MDDKLLKVKEVFDKVRDMRDEIGSLFRVLEGRITKLGDVYNDFIDNTKRLKTPDVKAFIFSLDSFYFQNSLLKREYDYLNDYYNIIINRMYGEYYKLYNLMTDYVEKSHIDNKLNELLKNKKYPKYDDLDETKVYDFSLIVQLNEDIIGVVSHLINILRDKEQSLKSYTANQNFGLNVNNFVSTFNYDVVMLNEQIILYEKYLDFFYHVHEKLLKRLITKISLLEAQLNSDIQFEGGLIGKRKDNKSLMKDMNFDGLNKKTARDLRKSMVAKRGSSFITTNTSDSEDYDNEIKKANEVSDFIPIDKIPPNSPNIPSLEINHFGRNENIRVNLDNQHSLVRKMFQQLSSENEILDDVDEELSEQEQEQEQEQEEEEEEEEEEVGFPVKGDSRDELGIKISQR